MLENIPLEIWSLLITAGLGLLTSVLGTKYSKYKKLFKLIVEVVEDGEVTKEEISKIVKSINKL